MSKPTPIDYAIADRLAGLAQDATRAVEQAGRGLRVVFDSCNANTTGLHTLVQLGAIAGYIADAQRLLAERAELETKKVIV